jgi:hypothetical protein
MKYSNITSCDILYYTLYVQCILDGVVYGAVKLGSTNNIYVCFYHTYIPIHKYNHSILTANGRRHPSITAICLAFLLSKRNIFIYIRYTVHAVYTSRLRVAVLLSRCAKNYWPGHAKNRNDIVRRGGIGADNGDGKDEIQKI